MKRLCGDGKFCRLHRQFHSIPVENISEIHPDDIQVVKQNVTWGQSLKPCYSDDKIRFCSSAAKVRSEAVEVTGTLILILPPFEFRNILTRPQLLYPL